MVHRWELGTHGWNEGPVFFPLRALLDPAPDRVDFFRRQPVLAGIRRRHADALIVGRNAVKDFARGRIPRPDREAASEIDARAFFGVEAERTHPRRVVRSVADEAVVRKDGQDVAIESNRIDRPRGGVKFTRETNQNRAENKLPDRRPHGRLLGDVDDSFPGGSRANAGRKPGCS